MKTLWSMLGALLISIIIIELGRVYVVYNNIVTATEHALDAGLIQAVKEEDARHGVIFIDEDLARAAAEETFRKNLNLDENGNNKTMKNTSLTLEVHQADNITASSTPYLSSTVQTSIVLMSPTIFGQPAVDFMINKNQYHLTTYCGTE